MRTPILAALCLAAVLGAGAGCSRSTGGGEARYLALFASAWQKCHTLGLYEVRVEAVTPLPDGVKRVVVRYLFNNGMVPDQGRAAMLVNAQGRLASDCVLDLAAGICLCGAGKDWHDGP
uniref:Lipoprotein n=1 Tax=Desulfovibrio sp. U5L TaxID=596152 RepID=I2PY78_9BACT